MKRREILIGIMAAALVPPSAHAQSAAQSPFVEQVITLLRGEGYRRLALSKTWLGRVRIVAESDTQRREIIVNPRTGEILRDYWEEILADGSSPSGLFDPDQEYDDDDYDDYDDYDDDDDNSGKGSSNSGKGSGGSNDDDD